MKEVLEEDVGIKKGEIEVLVRKEGKASKSSVIREGDAKGGC